MRLESRACSFEFEPVGLLIEPERFTDVFALKNNKTARETLMHPRYRKLVPLVQPRYEFGLDQALGSFLLDLKRQGRPEYRAFLNRYGDGTYCAFQLSSDAPLAQRGLYAFSVGGEVKYIGRCRDSFGKRLNLGYGRIHPKNCYLDGQATNCHLNGLIAQQDAEGLTLHVHVMQAGDEIVAAELALIERYLPEWNIALYGRR